MTTQVIDCIMRFLIMNKNQIELSQKMIDNLEIGDIKSIKEIFIDKWIDIVNPKQFGKLFKEAVKKKILINIKYFEIRNNGRCDTYERI